MNLLSHSPKSLFAEVTLGDCFVSFLSKIVPLSLFLLLFQRYPEVFSVRNYFRTELLQHKDAILMEVQDADGTLQALWNCGSWMRKE